MAANKGKLVSSEADDRVRIHYIKSNAYREIHADGAWGGITPSLLIHFALYSQRQPIPREMVFEHEGMKLGAEKQELRVSRSGVIREVDVGVYMDLRAAKVFQEWLSVKVRELEGTVIEMNSLQREQKE